MTDGGDYDTEMHRHRPLDDEAIEAFFTGRAAPDDLVRLVGLVEDLHSMASGPAPAPSTQLAAMLADGFSTEEGDLQVTAASPVTGLSPEAAGGSSTRRRKLVGTFLAGLSVAAKAGFGIGVAAAAVTAGGAAGVLPGPAQHAVATTVGAVTPFSFPDKANTHAHLGGTVSTDARDGGVEGKTFSTDAKPNGGVNPPAAPGQKGLDQANTTPAAGHAPTAVPGGQPATAGSQSPAGLGNAAGTPAGGHVPTSVAAGPPASTAPAGAGPRSTGLGTAGGTPAAGHVAGPVPPARPGRR